MPTRPNAAPSVRTAMEPSGARIPHPDPTVGAGGRPRIATDDRPGARTAGVGPERPGGPGARTGATPERPGAPTRPGTLGTPQNRLIDTHGAHFPRPSHLVPYPDAHHPPPVHPHYRPYYANYWQHPYYRWTYPVSCVYGFDTYAYPWSYWWAPAFWFGWGWSAGYWGPGGYWIPGYWYPTTPAPIYYGASYSWVPGFWEDDQTYVQGYWRSDQRDGWSWVDGAYDADGDYTWGDWVPDEPGPEGYVWESGYWDGQTWVDGFWRPQYLDGFRWVGAFYDDQGLFHGGYWEPTAENPGHVWIPGWFDGDKWVPGYWVTQQEYDATDVQSWKPAVPLDQTKQGEPVRPSAPSAREDQGTARPGEMDTGEPGDTGGPAEEAPAGQGEAPLAVPAPMD